MSEEIAPLSPGADESIDFLLAQICRLHYTRAHFHLEHIGLYRGQPPLLSLLHAEEGLTQSDLAARLNVKPATMTKMLQRMARAGFVQRRPDASDQRVSRVYLTEAGREAGRVMVGTLAALEEETFAGLSVEDRLLLRRLFRQIWENLRQVTATADAAESGARRVK